MIAKFFALLFLTVCFAIGADEGPILRLPPSGILALVKQAENGDAKAQCDLGVNYSIGIGVPKNDILAVSWFRKAAEQGDAVGQRMLGHCYIHGRGVDKDEALGMSWHRKSAEQGNAEGQLSLGYCYGSGLGVPKDEVLALEWYEKSAEQGNQYALQTLGECYRVGRGVPKDLGLALQWFRKAANRGNFEAQWRVAKDYAIRKENVLAYMWADRSAVGNVAKAKTLQHGLSLLMTPEQIAEAQRLSREWKPTLAE